jgi:WAS family protein 1
MLDPLGTVGKMKQMTEDDHDSIKMEAAPLSISQKEQIKRPTGENYFYSPGLGDVPQLDVPMDLPDLPGNIYYILLILNKTILLFFNSRPKW